MNTSKVKKIAVLVLIVGLIFIQVLSPKVNAAGLENLNELFGNQIGNNNNMLDDGNNAAGNNAIGNNAAANNATTLPKTGTNENIVITLMVICLISSIYAFKKVKEYNM